MTSEDVILFGEWCYAKHSIGYSALPGYFVAFDIFIKSEKKYGESILRRVRCEYSHSRFVSRTELERIVEPTGIPLIRKLHGDLRANSIKDLTNLLETTSEYYDGKIEGKRLVAILEFECIHSHSPGIYIRIDEGNWNKDRVKIVRPDFIQGASMY